MASAFCASSSELAPPGTTTASYRTEDVVRNVWDTSIGRPSAERIGPRASETTSTLAPWPHSAPQIASTSAMLTPGRASSATLRDLMLGLGWFARLRARDDLTGGRPSFTRAAAL